MAVLQFHSQLEGSAFDQIKRTKKYTIHKNSPYFLWAVSAGEDPSERWRVLDDTVVLLDVEPGDSGVYQCEVSNRHGRLLANTNIVVLGELACSAVAQPSVGAAHVKLSYIKNKMLAFGRHQKLCGRCGI